jgi:hypothetical protein
MKTLRLLIPTFLVLTLVSAPAHASLFEWIFGGGQNNHKSFNACVHAVFKRDNNRGQLDRQYLVNQCKKFVRNAQDQCEVGRLLDVEHGNKYSCTESGSHEELPYFGHSLDLCWDRLICD